MCLCTLSLTSALDVMGGQRHVPAALPTGMIRYPLYNTGGGVGPVASLEGCGKSRSSPGFNHRTVQPVTSRRNDYGILTYMVKKKHTGSTECVRHLRLLPRST
jgi:hypothetical protein